MPDRDSQDTVTRHGNFRRAKTSHTSVETETWKTRMWANAQRDGRPAEHSWRPLFNAAKVGWRPTCSNAAKTRNPLKFAGVPQTTGSISAVNGPNFTILCGHVEDILMLNNFFRLSICALVAKRARQSCAMVLRWLFLATFASCVFSVQQVSDLHLKFALRPHHVWKYCRHPICSGWD